jgi:hypothetical protein
MIIERLCFGLLFLLMIAAIAVLIVGAVMSVAVGLWGFALFLLPFVFVCGVAAIMAALIVVGK